MKRSILSDENRVMLTFRANEKDTRKGFKAKLTMIKGKASVHVSLYRIKMLDVCELLYFSVGCLILIFIWNEISYFTVSYQNA